LKKWPYKRGGLTLGGQISILPSQCIWHLAW